MIGKFEHRMEVQQLTTQESGFEDGPPDQWERVFEEMFLLRPSQGREEENADTMRSTVTHEAKCHFPMSVKVDSGMRIKYGDRIFHVESVVNEFERNRFLVWKLVEVDS